MAVNATSFGTVLLKSPITQIPDQNMNDIHVLRLVPNTYISGCKSIQYYNVYLDYTIMSYSEIIFQILSSVDVTSKMQIKYETVRYF